MYFAISARGLCSQANGGSIELLRKRSLIALFLSYFSNSCHTKKDFALAPTGEISPSTILLSVTLYELQP
jgi:hypothetical protein